ncbi:M14 family metallopeptidase [Sphingosinicella soli]|uniref:DUF2817 domain-containing protein n=1 Tax=Sphingosinicella soli TaxID=333708 RepID=A0A7W7AZW1_9SPHN|nr:M14 family metallopeptidase [Sphingosinicella soli]MBB4631450.1 hypothetical protein [Sphingosinicella soli]
MNSADSFSADYRGARAKFLEDAQAAGGSLETITHPERGPDGGEVFTDVAAFGVEGAERVLVLISGTHGVEGFCGSGAQVDLLRRGETARRPEGVGILMIHAVNPYGFAWLRRVTHENIDLNRNWIDFSKPLPANPGYDLLHSAICPPVWDDAAQAASALATTRYADAHGALAMRAAMMGGQYTHADGLFYGGTAPSWSRTTQSAILTHYLANAAKIGIIDYHTGLGPWGFAEQIIVSARESDGFRRAARWYGAALASVADGQSASVRIEGDGLSAAPALLPGADVTSMAIEVGTHPTDHILAALQADCRLHAHGDPASPDAKPIKDAIRNAFYGDADDWKGMVAGQSLLAVRQALAGLSAD